jgi:hypothetical protein
VAASSTRLAARAVSVCRDAGRVGMAVMLLDGFPRT